MILLLKGYENGVLKTDTDFGFEIKKKSVADGPILIPFINKKLTF